MGSSARRKFRMTLFPSARDENIIARWEIDLSDGGVTFPSKGPLYLTLIRFNRLPCLFGPSEFLFETVPVRCLDKFYHAGERG
jgi:hypothetical protein